MEGQIKGEMNLIMGEFQTKVTDKLREEFTEFIRSEVESSIGDVRVEIDYDLIANKILSMIADDDRFQPEGLTTQQLIALMNQIPEEDLAKWAKEKLPGIQPQWVAPDGTVHRTGKVVKLGQRLKLINRDTFSKE